ncbi:hypothetical protein BLNAU_13258 [Blattamonas nauphoetae]|uniref:Uncharacterized protein n=1 Tax=Blattamonas nauphoetae TaxID=2049346 RepID=A0ABQ9XKN3_9EUKA|nr:hypothetical protein BLNAU_13258 [Blattamonas nauphoetae]
MQTLFSEGFEVIIEQQLIHNNAAYFGTDVVDNCHLINNICYALQSSRMISTFGFVVLNTASFNRLIVCGSLQTTIIWERIPLCLLADSRKQTSSPKS